jgi:hypothetical protein
MTKKEWGERKKKEDKYMNAECMINLQFLYSKVLSSVKSKLDVLSSLTTVLMLAS